MCIACFHTFTAARSALTNRTSEIKQHQLVHFCTQLTSGISNINVSIESVHLFAKCTTLTRKHMMLSISSQQPNVWRGGSVYVSFDLLGGCRR
jgi:hypothetical protein